MSFTGHLSTFAGLPVRAFDPEGGLPGDPSAVAWRLEVEDFDADADEFVELVDGWLRRVPGEAVRAVVVGEWGSAYEQSPPLDLLISLAGRLPGLRALFLGDLVGEQCEASWIQQSDVTPLLAAYPGLVEFGVRGGAGLELEPVRSSALRTLIVQTGGLPGGVVRAVGASDLPSLSHLELWLGVEEYGCDTSVADLAGVLSGERLPALRQLAVCNAGIADAVAAAVAAAAVVPRLEVLDLSKGILTDAGAGALLAGQPLTHLRRLDLHHNFLSAEMCERLAAALPGVEVDVSDSRRPIGDDDPYLYTAVAE